MARYDSYIDVLFEKKWTPYEKIHFWIDSNTFFIRFHSNSKTYHFITNLFRAYLGHSASIFRICCQILLVLSVRATIG